MLRRWLAWAFVSLLCGMPMGARGQDQPKEVVGRMLEAYARLISYRDAGTVTITPDSGEHIAPGRWKTERKFETFFQAGVGFRFDHMTIKHDAKTTWDSTSRWILCAHDSAFTVWLHYQSDNPSFTPSLVRRPEPSAEVGIAALAGVTRSVSCYLPALLLDENLARQNIGLGNPIYWVGVEQAEGAECVRLRTNNPWGVIELWVAKQDWLLRRIVVDGGGSRREIRITAIRTDETFVREDFTVEPGWFKLARTTREW